MNPHTNAAPFAVAAATGVAEPGVGILPEDATRLFGAFFLALIVAGVLICLGLFAHMRVRPVDWKRRIAVLAARPWSRHHLLAAGFLLIFLHMAMLSVARAFGSRAAAFEEAALFVAQTLIFHWAILLLIGLTLFRRRLSLREAFGWEGRSWAAQVGWGALFYVAAMPLVVFYTWLYQAGLRWMGYAPDMQDIVRILLSDTPRSLRVYFIFVSVVLAPLAEELLFRGIGLPLLLRRLDAAPAIIVLSALFATLHLNLGAFMPLFLISCAFSAAYLYSTTIMTPIVMHAMFNAVNLGVLYVLSHA